MGKKVDPRFLGFRILTAGGTHANLGPIIFVIPFSGQNLVPKPADQVEEAEPGHGRQQRHAPLSPGIDPVPLLRRSPLPLPLGTAGETSLLNM